MDGETRAARTWQRSPVDWLAGVWAKVFATLATAGILAGGGAVIQARVNSNDVSTVATEVKELDVRQRKDHDDLIELKTDVGYMRRALNKLLDHAHIDRPD